jgi:hypothetical protein
VLVPATMELLGDANWWFPKWLDRIVPRISVEAAPDLAPKPPVAADGDGDGDGARPKRKRPLVAKK